MILAMRERGAHWEPQTSGTPQRARQCAFCRTLQLGQRAAQRHGAWKPTNEPKIAAPDDAGAPGAWTRLTCVTQPQCALE
jgi:hypothetical protein